MQFMAGSNLESVSLQSVIVSSGMLREGEERDARRLKLRFDAGSILSYTRLKNQVMLILMLP